VACRARLEKTDGLCEDFVDIVAARDSEGRSSGGEIEGMIFEKFGGGLNKFFFVVVDDKSGLLVFDGAGNGGDGGGDDRKAAEKVKPDFTWGSIKRKIAFCLGVGSEADGALG